MTWHTQVRDYIEFIKHKYELEDSDIQQELFSTDIPTDAYTTTLTPLQAATKYLRENKQKTTKEISQIIGRTTTEIETILRATNNTPPLPNTGIPLPANKLADRSLSAAEHLVHMLTTRGHTIKDISRLLNKKEQTIWTLHYRIQQKTGGKTQ